MVQLVNKIFSRFVFVMYITFLLISCLIYYLYLFLKGLHGLRIILLCLIIFFTAVISCSSLTAADVAQAAYKPQSSIYRLIIYGKISSKEQIKMHTVMKGLMVNKVGISCMDFFILTRNGILKVFTTLVSYVLILVQVQQLDIEEKC
ncbi:uncharacterized protein [Centruroides vittatus]|uniref:uncharacterized protein n=1 Tax=Centruroides vittatus TaxID=120091 RepID=UPI00350FF4C2